MHGNIAVLAGEPDAGKTAFLLNLTRLNMAHQEVHYFSSEMGAMELRERSKLFPEITLDQWRFYPKELARDFADVIEPAAFNDVAERDLRLLS